MARPLHTLRHAELLADQWLAATIHQELEQEVTFYADALPKLEGSVDRGVPCRTVMQHPVRWVTETDTARTAARVMRDANIGFLVVCDASARVVGTLTDRDLVTRLLADDPASTKTDPIHFRG